VATGCSREVIEGRTALANLLRGIHPGHPAIAVGDHAAKDIASRHGADIDRGMRLLHGLGKGDHRGKIVELAVTLGLLLAPELLHDQDGFPSLAPAMVKVAPHNFTLLAEPSCPNAKDESTTREVIECRDLLGEEQRMVLGDETHAGPQLNTCGDSRGPAE